MSHIIGNTLKTSATVKVARQEVGRALNQSDAKEQLRMLNMVREWAYANQRKLGLDLSVTLCVSVECLCHECPTCPDEPLFKGFRLPLRFQSIETVRHRNDHVPVFSHWRLPYDGVSGYPNDNSIKLFDNGWHPLERDFTDCCQQRIRFWSEGCPVEKCQEMEITGTTQEDRKETKRYSVGREPKITDEFFKDIHSVSFCDGVSGRVILAEESGRELARYDDGQSAPQFREYKVIGGCDPKQLVIIANCSYSNLSDECDIVEFGDPLIWQTLARYVQLLNKSDKDGNDRANMESYLQTAVSIMQEKSAVDLSETIGARIRRAPLTGNRLSTEYYGAPRRSHGKGNCCHR